MLGHPRLEGDLAITAVGVVQAGPRCAARRGLGGQWNAARMTTTTMARNAVPY
jgi:hypothetical protein